MKAKEKAIEIVKQFTMNNTIDGEINAIKCALICVDEIINTCALDEDNIRKNNSTHRIYWDEVRQEIEKL